MSILVRGVFRSPEAANAAVEELTAMGYGPDAITVAMSSQTRSGLGLHESIDGTHVGRAATGGAVLGGLAAIVATVATGGLAFPIIAGAMAGIAGGSALGALVGAAGSEEERERLEQDIDAGAILVAVQAREEDVPRAQAILAPPVETSTGTEVVGAPLTAPVRTTVADDSLTVPARASVPTISSRDDVTYTGTDVRDATNEEVHRSIADEEQVKRDTFGDEMTPGEKVASVGNQAKNTIQADVDAGKRDVRSTI